MKDRSFEKLLAALLAMTFAAGMTGCKSEKAESDTSDETDATVRYETEFAIEKWTLDDVSDSLKLCGEDFSLPCRIADMENFSLTESDVGDGSSQYITSASGLLYNGEKAACAGFKDDNSDEIRILLIGANTDTLPEFSVMGITNDSTPDDVVAALGEPNAAKDKDGRVYRYLFSDNTALMFVFDKDSDSIKTVFISV